MGPQGPGRPAGRPEIRRDQARFQGFFLPKIGISPKIMPKKVKKKVEIEGVGPPWRDPRRNSVQDGAGNANNDNVATRLVTKRLFWGSLGVPGPARTPLGSKGVSRLACRDWRPVQVLLIVANHC